MESPKHSQYPLSNFDSFPLPWDLKIKPTRMVNPLKQGKNIFLERIFKELTSTFFFNGGGMIISHPLVAEKTEVKVQGIGDNETWIKNNLASLNVSSKEILPDPYGNQKTYIFLPINFSNEVVGGIWVVRENISPNMCKRDIPHLSLFCSIVSHFLKYWDQSKLKETLLKEENQILGKQLKNNFLPKKMIGKSKPIEEVYGLIEKVMDGQTTVLILGESGVGKERVAQELHFASSRSERPFIRVNCSSLPKDMIESELFGHEKGSYLGASQGRIGRFELAQKGTIFLDEVGDLPLETQSKLLRIIQEKEFERVGGNETILCDVRILASSNRNLEEMVKKGEFREDLYYRLNIFPINVPPLRNRTDDILPLADHFVESFSAIHEKNVKRISTRALNMLREYHWPGNVRELSNCMERAVLMSDEGVVYPHHLPPSLQTGKESDTGPKKSLDDRLRQVEKGLIEDALKNSNGNVALASRMLGITERVAGLRVRKYRIRPKDFRRKSN